MACLLPGKQAGVAVIFSLIGAVRIGDILCVAALNGVDLSLRLRSVPVYATVGQSVKALHDDASPWLVVIAGTIEDAERTEKAAACPWIEGAVRGIKPDA